MAELTEAGPAKKGRKGVVSEKQWTNEEVERLINIWSTKEVLYNVANADYMDKNKKQIALREISTEMNIPEPFIQKKMHSLRPYYGSLKHNFKKS